MGTSETVTEKLSQQPIYQIGCSAFCRIRDSDGKYMLTINAHRYSKGQTILSPPGGGIHPTQKGRLLIEKLSGFVDNSWVGNNLKFKLTNLMGLLDFAEIFFISAARETNAAKREFCEELAKETHILTLAQAKSIACQLAGYSLQVVSPIDDDDLHPGIQKIRFIEIWDGELPAPLIHQLVHSTIYFVTAEEIIAGRTHDGITIGAVSKSLLNPTSQEAILTGARNLVQGQ